VTGRAAAPAEALRDAVRRCDDAAAQAALDALDDALSQLRSRVAFQSAHDALLFATAHPTSEAARRRAEACLASLARAIEARIEADPALDARLANSALPGTLIEASLSHPLASWLARTYPTRVAWGGADADLELTQLFMRGALLPGEGERLEREHHPLDRWLARSGAAANSRRLRAVLNGVAAATQDERMQEYLFASLKPFVRWRLSPPSASIATARSLPRAPSMQRDWRRDVSVAERVAAPLPRPANLSAAGRETLIGSARVVLGTLLRETDPVTYADPRAVTLFRLDRGIDVALFGMRPAWRLALETYYGYLAFKNGVPAAYGGAWMFGHRCKIGVNVFPFMRGGESALLFAELMRVYRQHFGPEVFFVEPYQIGRGNPDGIRSGAFWFYYRLGFRPVERDLAALAEDEAQRMASDRSHRSSAATLRRLADSDLRWSSRDPGALPVPDPYRVNRALTAFVRRVYRGDRAAAIAATRARTVNLFADVAPRPQARAIAQAFGPLLAMLGGLARWSADERRALARLLAEKLSGDEREHARMLRRHAPLLRALAAAAEAAPES
jgi:hypothetical protein